jgi:hypothetical protein
MLGEAGGIAAAQFTIEVGGRVLVADEWVGVLKLNRVCSGTIPLWETDENLSLQDMAVAQEINPYKSTRLLLDGQQRLPFCAHSRRGCQSPGAPPSHRIAV